MKNLFMVLKNIVWFIVGLLVIRFGYMIIRFIGKLVLNILTGGKWGWSW